MYWFFGMATGLETRHLPSYRQAMEAAGSVPKRTGPAWPDSSAPSCGPLLNDAPVDRNLTVFGVTP
jgi:hypothetical protein